MKKLLIAVTIFASSLLGLNAQAYATNNLTQFGEALGSDKVNILKGCAGDNDGIKCILDLVVDILSIGVGILGVIGISIVGIQYLTAGGSEEKTRKAKRRMFEIIIGLAAYAVIYALAQFLLQPSNGGGSSGSSGGSSGNGGGTTLHESSSGENHGGRSGSF